MPRAEQRVWKMPIGWLDRLKEFIPTRAPAAPPDDSALLHGPPAPDAPAESAPARIPTYLKWAASVRLYFPLGMFVIGGMMSACTQLIGTWAFLGYLLLVTAPIVYQLQRVERALDRVYERRVRPQPPR